jgi:hypothetical protein
VVKQTPAAAAIPSALFRKKLRFNIWDSLRIDPVTGLCSCGKTIATQKPPTLVVEAAFFVDLWPANSG